MASITIASHSAWLDVYNVEKVGTSKSLHFSHAKPLTSRNSHASRAPLWRRRFIILNRSIEIHRILIAAIPERYSYPTSSDGFSGPSISQSGRIYERSSQGTSCWGPHVPWNRNSVGGVTQTNRSICTASRITIVVQAWVAQSRSDGLFKSSL